MIRNVVLAAMLAAAMAAPRDRSFFEEKFLNWMKTHDIEARDGSHFVHMLENFIENDRLIEAHNAGNHSYTVGHNKFSHMNREEWASFVKGFTAVPSPLQAAKDHTVPANYQPKSEHFNTDTPVKNQGSCGSCWAFSTVGALEGAYIKKNGKEVDFSEQYFVDCDFPANHACKGGLMTTAFEYGMSNGLMLESNYKYVSGTSTAKGDCTAPAQKDVTDKFSYYNVPMVNSGNYDYPLLSALEVTNVAVAIKASSFAFQMYQSGVLDATNCGTDLDHGVVAVGYGVEDGKAYYKVKNSWGDSWGEKGYVKIPRGNEFGKLGACGILQMNSYPQFE